MSGLATKHARAEQQLVPDGRKSVRGKFEKEECWKELVIGKTGKIDMRKVTDRGLEITTRKSVSTKPRNKMTSRKKATKNNLNNLCFAGSNAPELNTKKNLLNVDFCAEKVTVVENKENVITVKRKEDQPRRLEVEKIEIAH